MILLWLLPALGAATADETYSVTLVFQTMHCNECKADVEAMARKLPGFASVTFAETSATIQLGEKAPVPTVSGIPKDMGFKGTRLSIRGTVSFSGDKATLVAKGSGTTFALSGGEKVGELKKQAGGKSNKFHVSGTLAGKALVVESFQLVEWKD